MKRRYLLPLSIAITTVFIAVPQVFAACLDPDQCVILSQIDADVKNISGWIGLCFVTAIFLLIGLFAYKMMDAFTDF